jgi:hypothetical protein
MWIMTTYQIKAHRLVTFLHSPIGALTNFILLFLYSLYAAVTGGLIQTDDTWFVQVASRLLEGDVLYRQVYFGITPLSIYITGALARLFGAEVLILKVIIALCFSVTCLLTYHTAQKLDLRRFDAVLVLLFLLAYLPFDLRYGVPYTPMASMFLLMTFSATLSWRNSLEGATREGGFEPLWVLLGVAGACAGFGFTSKQNIGLYTLAALISAILVIHLEMKTRIRELFWAFSIALGACLLTAGIIHLPILWNGSLGRYLEYGFLNKGFYLVAGRISYFGRLGEVVRLALSPTSLRDLLTVYLGVQYLIPFLTFGALGYALLSGDPGDRSLLIVVLLFALAAIADVYPNAARSHVQNALPTLLIGLAFALRQTRINLSARFTLVLRSGLVLWATIGIFALVLQPIRWMASGEYVFSRLPNFRAVLLQKSFLEETQVNTDRLVRAAGENPTFLFIQRASYYYLVTGLENPTPYDLPLVPALGLYGESEIIAAIEGGDIKFVCMQQLGKHPRKPLQLEGYVLNNMGEVRKLKLCTLYERRPD